MPGPLVATMSPEASEAIVRLLDTSQLEGEFDRLLDRIQEVHPPDASGGPFDLRRISLGVATHLWSTAQDHLRAWSFLVRSTMPVSAHLTLARGCLDCSVYVLWMLDGDDPSRWRVRAAQYQLEDHRQRANFEMAAGEVEQEDGGMTGRQRQAGLEKAMRVANIPTDRPPQWLQLYREYALPPDDDVGEAYYRLVSGHAHGFQWPLLTYVRVPPEEGIGGLGSVIADDHTTVQHAQVSRLTLERSLRELHKLTAPLD